MMQKVGWSIFLQSQCQLALGRPHAQIADHRHRLLLCARRQRPSRRGAEQRDELALLTR